MQTLLVFVFVVAYAAIALEHSIKVKKSASPLVGAGLLWTIYALANGDAHAVTDGLGESAMATAQIVFVLMVAMAIVEVVDAHNGFDVTTKRIRMKSAFLPSVMSLVVPLAATACFLRGKSVESPRSSKETPDTGTADFERKLMFFMGLGILLTVATLEHTHILTVLARWLDQTVGRQDVIVLIIGAISAVVDNVPLVASSMGMYSFDRYPTDHFLWQFLAYCAGTGGATLIFGSAAGVAAMGLEKIHFFWYAKKISWLALVGYFAGAGGFLLQFHLLR